MFIIDPKTYEKINIQTKQGLSLLKSYVKYFQNSGSEKSSELSSDSDSDSDSSVSDSNIMDKTVIFPETTKKSENQGIPIDKFGNIIGDVTAINDQANPAEAQVIENLEAKEGNSSTGTFAFTPPELSYLSNYKDEDGNGKGNTNSLKSDIWAMGITFFKIFMNFDFYIILSNIHQNQNKNKNYKHNDTKVMKTIIEQAKEVKKIIPVTIMSYPPFITEQTVSTSMKYIDYIVEEQKAQHSLSTKNLEKLKQIFELIKMMIKFKIADRIDINEVVEELKNITGINDTDHITIPFDESNHEIIQRKSEKHSITDLEKVTEDWSRINKVGIYKIGNKPHEDELFIINDDKRKDCNNRNSCAIFKRENKDVVNELIIHNYLNKQDVTHKYIINLYTHKIDDEENRYIYMEHIPYSLEEYINSNFKMPELKKYYKETNRKKNKGNQIGTQREVDKLQKEAQKLYEEYEKASGKELGEEKCSNIDNNSGKDICKLHDHKSGTVKCGSYGTKRKCKTTNKQLAIKVIDNRIFKEKCIIMLKAAEALQFIHKNNIFHSDIKPDNIVVQRINMDGTDKYTVKFIDFGVSCVFKDNKMYTFGLSEESKAKAEAEEESESSFDSGLYQMDDNDLYI